MGIYASYQLCSLFFVTAVPLNRVRRIYSRATKTANSNADTCTSEGDHFDLSIITVNNIKTWDTPNNCRNSPKTERFRFTMQ